MTHFACGLDFGTSNSTVGVVRGGQPTLLPLEDGKITIPSAIFFNTEDDVTSYGRAALADYLSGYEGRLMRSLKSLLGSKLIDDQTEVQGRAMPFRELLAQFIGELKRRAEATAGRSFSNAVLGRPVFFVDGDPEADRRAEDTLAEVARAVGFRDIAFQYEPIAAAFDYEATIHGEQLVLVADIGGGTSDFSVVRVGPERAQRVERRDDIVASHGVHIAGTDFDRRVSLATIMPLLGHGTMGVAQPGEMALPISSRIYFDLATWHLINTLYQPARVAEVRALQPVYANPVHHQRLLKVLTARLGHALAGQAEAAKIAVAEGHDGSLDLTLLERDLHAELDAAHTEQALHDDIDKSFHATVTDHARDSWA